MYPIKRTTKSKIRLFKLIFTNVLGDHWALHYYKTYTLEVIVQADK